MNDDEENRHYFETSALRWRLIIWWWKNC